MSWGCVCRFWLTNIDPTVTKDQETSEIWLQIICRKNTIILGFLPDNMTNNIRCLIIWCNPENVWFGSMPTNLPQTGRK